ncbi:hypothetical protein ABW20_dc0109936 [Dactylellina cionopaga]|nr:hypothetical protein ABW20_dc0109936 [Dactylellina cionopaga]
MEQLESEDYTISWICALPLEFAVATALLDERHLPLPQDDIDDNSYEFGRIGRYNIIIACLPSGVYGVTSAANVATNLQRSFPSVKTGLLVGIGGGAPVLPHNDIRLGDVVVSEPVPGYGGVLQYDFGKTIQEGKFVPTGVLNKPPGIFLKAIAKLKAQSLLEPRDVRSSETRGGTHSAINNIITEALENEVVPRNFARPDVNSDRLFQAEYDHPFNNGSCDECDFGMLCERSPRSLDQPHIHYGLIASGNQIMKHGITRDRLSKEGVLCFEMEAAGLMDELPSLVIRGICDYSDSHKSKIWQPYAALAAGAFAKELLLQLPVRTSNKSQPGATIHNITLPEAEGAAFGSYTDQHEPECLPGTRIEILRHITEWASDKTGRCLFWLVGRAGTGKSTISRTIARTLLEKKLLGATFFFKRGEADRSTGALFFTTIALQLANRLPGIKLDIQRAIDEDQTISRKALKEQFDKLIFEPLSRLNSVSRTGKPMLVVIVDALDECEPKEDIRIIIYLLARLKNIKTVDIRVYLTSRPDFPIRLGFQKLSDDTYEDLVLHEVPTIEHDISLFLQFELSKIREDHSLPSAWPGDERIQELVLMAVPLFIYAATLCRFVGDEDWDPEERITAIIDYGGSSQQPLKLDRTYMPILNQLIKGRDQMEIDKLTREFKEVVGTIINLASPLSIKALARLLSISEATISSRLRPLHSVLDVPSDSSTPVRTFHLSFRDFLLDQTFRGKSQFWVDEKEAHRKIASHCIELMSRPGGLKQDICNLKAPGILRSEICEGVVEQFLPPELQYACHYWVYHLKECGDMIHDDGQVHVFLHQHLLHWLEATSLLGDMASMISTVDVLSSTIDIESGSLLSEFLYDTRRFVFKNQALIALVPLQTYLSALIFIPAQSIVRKIFDPEKMIEWIYQFPQVQENWGALLQTLDAHNNAVNCVQFSPDGEILGSSAHNDIKISLRDATTGALLQTLCSRDPISSIAFSYDGKLASASRSNKTVALWDTRSGLLLQTLEGHTGFVYTVVFMSNNILASGSSDKTIRLWDTSTGVPLKKLEGHSHIVTDLLFSHIYKHRLVSASYDETIKLWDTDSGAILNDLREHKGPVRISLALSRSGKLASSSKNYIKLRDFNIDSNASFQILMGHQEMVSSVQFSSDGKLLASASLDKVIKLWNSVTGMLLKSFENDAGVVGAHGLAFSCDSKFLASGSSDGTIRLWDMESHSKTPSQRLVQKKHEGSITAMTFSPNSKFLLSTSYDKMVGLWNTKNGKLVQMCRRYGTMTKPLNTKGLGQVFRMHQGVITAMVFSCNGKLASALAGGLIQLWDFNNETGTLRHISTLKGHRKDIHTLTFSVDGNTLASLSFDQTIRIWDVTTGVLLRNLDGVGPINRTAGAIVVFSDNGRFLALAREADISNMTSVKLWDMNTTTDTLPQILTLQANLNLSNAAAFSPGRVQRHDL